MDLRNEQGLLVVRKFLCEVFIVFKLLIHVYLLPPQSYLKTHGYEKGDANSSTDK